MLDYNVKLHTKVPPDLLEIGAAWGGGDQQLPCQGTWDTSVCSIRRAMCFLPSSSRSPWSSPPNSGLEADLSAESLDMLGSFRRDTHPKYVVPALQML